MLSGKKFGDHPLSVDSNEELYVLWWLEELKKRGYVDRYSRAPSFILSKRVDAVKKIQLKTKIKEQTYELLAGHQYTADFKVYWHVSAVGLFISLDITGPLIAMMEEGELVTYLEVKPLFDSNNMTRLFRLNQKWMYQCHHIYVNLIIYQRLYADTFTPDRFRYTDKTYQLRKLPTSYRSIEEYVTGAKDRGGSRDEMG